MTAWFLNSNSHSNDQNICRIKWSILSLTAGFYWRNCWLEKSRCQIYSCSEFTSQCHGHSSHSHHDTELTTESQHWEDITNQIIWTNKTQNPGAWPSRLGSPAAVTRLSVARGPGISWYRHSELLLTNQGPVFWWVTNEEPGSVVWSSGTFHPCLVYCTMTSNYPHQVNNAMLPSSENMITNAGIKTVIHIRTGFKRRDKLTGGFGQCNWEWFAKCHFVQQTATWAMQRTCYSKLLLLWSSDVSD